MRNAGNLDTARDVYADFQSVAFRAVEVLSLPATRVTFALASDVLRERYFDLFEVVCDEIRSAEPAADGGVIPIWLLTAPSAGS